jgi:Rieske Fe-S protein
MSQTSNPPPASSHQIHERRSFLKWFTYLTGAVAAAVLVVPFVAYLFGALRKHKIQWIKLGPLSNFPVDQTRLVPFDNPLGQPWDGMSARMGVYVRNLGKDEKQQDRFLVLVNNCAHLGCPVTWFPQSRLFMCPCHGGVYYENGDRASGPPPRALFQAVWRINEGELEVQAPFLPTLQNSPMNPARV